MAAVVKNFTICKECGQYVHWGRKHEDSSRWPRDFFIPKHYRPDGTECPYQGEPTDDMCCLPEGIKHAPIFSSDRKIAIPENSRSTMPNPRVDYKGKKGEEVEA